MGGKVGKAHNKAIHLKRKKKTLARHTHIALEDMMPTMMNNIGLLAKSKPTSSPMMMRFTFLCLSLFLVAKGDYVQLECDFGRDDWSNANLDLDPDLSDCPSGVQADVFALMGETVQSTMECRLEGFVAEEPDTYYEQGGSVRRRTSSVRRRTSTNCGMCGFMGRPITQDCYLSCENCGSHGCDDKDGRMLDESDCEYDSDLSMVEEISGLCTDLIREYIEDMSDGCLGESDLAICTASVEAAE
jgi:hypothetical protein